MVGQRRPNPPRSYLVSLVPSPQVPPSGLTLRKADTLIGIGVYWVLLCRPQNRATPTLAGVFVFGHQCE